MPAPVAMLTFSVDFPVATKRAAAQRVPLPEISLVLPSEFQSSIAAGVPLFEFEIRIQPSAPAPVWRWQIARASAAGSPACGGNCSLHVSRKSFRAPCAFVNGIFTLFDALFPMVYFHHRRSFHNNFTPQRVACFPQRDIHGVAGKR